MEKREITKAYFMKGHSCAQAVLAAFRDELNMTENEALSLASMFGGGISGTRETCGVVTAALMVLGARKKLALPEEKAEAYRLGQEFIRAFQEKFTSVNCKTLLDNVNAKYYEVPRERNAEYYRERPCLLFVEAAAEMLSERHE